MQCVQCEVEGDFLDISYMIMTLKNVKKKFLKPGDMFIPLLNF